MLQDLVVEQVNNGHNKILLNLREVTYFNSSGIAGLLAAVTTMQNRGGEFWLKLIQKAKRAETTHELVAILKYLEDRAYGKPMQAVHHSPDQPVEVSVTHDVATDAAKRLDELLERAARRAAEKKTEAGGAGGTDLLIKNDQCDRCGKS